MTPPAFVVVHLTPDEIAIVRRPVVGGGGMQGLLKRLLPRLNDATGRLDLHPVEAEKVRRYADAYGDGGYQGRFRAIQAAVNRARAK